MALLDVAADRRRILALFVLALGAMIFGGIRMTEKQIAKAGGGARSAPRAGLWQSRGTVVLLLFLAVFFLAGFWRAESVRGRLEREAEWACRVEGVKVTARGSVLRATEKDGKLELWLREVHAEVGNVSGELGQLVVYGEGEISGIGMEVRVRGTLEAVEEATNPGQFDFARYYRSKGTACRMYGETMEVESDQVVPYLEGIRRLRAWCGGVLRQVCAPEDLGVFKAVVLGDQSSMDQEMRDMYRSHGISHLLAVSGQHLSIVGGGIYLMLRRAGLNRGKTGMIAGALVVSYGILTGGSGSAMRAVVMTLCLWLAGYLGKSYDCLSAMGLAGAWLLWREPYLIFQSGFQLSFGAVWAIGGLGSWLNGALEVKRGWQRTLVCSLCVQIGLAPVTLWHYFRYPLYGFVLNLFVVPLAAVLVYSGILGIVLGGIWLPAGVYAVGAGHYVLAFYEWMCRGFAQLPGYSLLAGRPGWGRIAVYGFGMMVGIWGIAGEKRKKGGGTGDGDEEGLGEGKRRGVRSFAVRFTGIFLLYGLCFCALLPRPRDGLRVTCLDVGQGDGIVLESRGGVVLVDGGSSSESGLAERCLEPFLESRALGHIDCALVSHGDADHVSGLLELLERGKISVGCVVLPRMGRGHGDYDKLREAAKRSGADVVYMEQGDRIRLGELTLSCLYAGDPRAETEKDKNRHSLAVRAEYGEFRMLLTGDMDAECERGMIGQWGESGLEGIQVLKVAHHGSDTSSSEALLDAVKPGLAVVSYGVGNSYGHPSGSVMERLRERKIEVWETGTCGAVLLETDGRAVRCWGWRKARE